MVGVMLKIVARIRPDLCIGCAEQYPSAVRGARVPVEPQRPAPFQTRDIITEFVICCQRRDELRAWLTEKQVGRRFITRSPFTCRSAFAQLGYQEGDFPVSEQLTRERSWRCPCIRNFSASRQLYPNGV